MCEGFINAKGKAIRLPRRLILAAWCTIQISFFDIGCHDTICRYTSWSQATSTTFIRNETRKVKWLQTRLMFGSSVRIHSIFWVTRNCKPCLTWSMLNPVLRVKISAGSKHNSFKIWLNHNISIDSILTMVPEAQESWVHFVIYIILMIRAQMICGWDKNIVLIKQWTKDLQNWML